MPLGKCPRCGGNIIEGNLGYGCSNYKSGCKFVIWKKAKGGIFKYVEITPEMAKKLLSGKVVESQKIYSPKKNKVFKGKFKLTDTNSEYGASYELIIKEKKPRRDVTIHRDKR